MVDKSLFLKNLSEIEIKKTNKFNKKTLTNFFRNRNNDKNKFLIINKNKTQDKLYFNQKSEEKDLFHPSILILSNKNIINNYYKRINDEKENIYYDIKYIKKLLDISEERRKFMIDKNKLRDLKVIESRESQSSKKITVHDFKLEMSYSKNKNENLTQITPLYKLSKNNSSESLLLNKNNSRTQYFINTNYKNQTIDFQTNNTSKSLKSKNISNNFTPKLKFKKSIFQLFNKELKTNKFTVSFQKNEKMRNKFEDIINFHNYQTMEKGLSIENLLDSRSNSNKDYKEQNLTPKNFLKYITESSEIINNYKIKKIVNENENIGQCKITKYCKQIDDLKKEYLRKIYS